MKLENVSYVIRRYQGKNWIDQNGHLLPTKCIIEPLSIECSKKIFDANTTQSKSSKNTIDMTKNSKESDDAKLCEDNEQRLIELHPPASVMPNGNVGTPTKVFLQLIRACKMPASVLKSLNLTFPKSRSNRRYGSVRHDYGGDTVAGTSNLEDVQTASGHDIESLSVSQFNHQQNLLSEIHESHLEQEDRRKANQPDVEAEESDEDNDTCESWERHEAFHDDVRKWQERDKERLFEEEIELVWEKGGPGVVFYTDEQFWRAQQGDFDEQTADDLDVDMSIYYEKDGGDKDARDFIKMRHEERQRRGVYDDMSTAIGKFEKHTRGVGRHILETLGWREGHGVGAEGRQGRSEALECEGQTGRAGLGYHGERVIFPGVLSSRRRPPPTDDDVYIGSAYDTAEERPRPEEPLLRSGGSRLVKYRDGFVRPQQHKLS